MVQLNNSPLQIIEANKSSWEKGKTREQVSVKISCIIIVPMNSPTRISFVQCFTISADLWTEDIVNQHLLTGITSQKVRVKKKKPEKSKTLETE